MANKKPSTKIKPNGRKSKPRDVAAPPRRVNAVRRVAKFTPNEISMSNVIGGDKFVIFDLDGCISDDAWRFQFVQEHPDADRRFEHYHGSLHLDEPLEEGASLLRRCIRSHMAIIFITARPELFREPTREWIGKHFGLVATGFTLLMRSDGDSSPTVTIKRELCALALEDISAESIVAAYDDREDVVTMYHSVFGINAYVLDKDGVRDPLNLQSHRTRGLAQDKARGASDTHPIEEGCDRAAHEPPNDPSEVFRNVEYKKYSIYEHPVSSSLANAIDTLENRLERYGRSDLIAGNVAAALFPNGLELGGNSSSMRMGMMMFHVIGKLTRFASSGMKDADSVHDMINYAGFMDAIMRDRAGRESVTGEHSPDEHIIGEQRPSPTSFI